MASTSNTRRFSWLHFSDFQFSSRSRSHSGYENASKALYHDLGRLHSRVGPWHAVFITGDLTSAGRDAEFKRCEKELMDLLNYLKKLGSEPSCYVLPGNHDVNRSVLSETDLSLLRLVADDPAATEELWVRHSLYRRVVETAFHDYTRWAKLSEVLAKREQGGLPGDFSASVDGAGCRVAVVGLNSAFAHLTVDDHDGRLVADQLRRACPGQDPDTWLGEHDTALLLTHHAPGSLNLDSRVRLRSQIAPAGRFAAHLCGHYHSGSWAANPVIPGQLVLQCRPFHNRTDRGYLAGSITLGDREHGLSVQPRLFDVQTLLFTDDPTFAYGLNDGDAFELRWPAPHRKTTKLYVPDTHGDEPPEPPVVLEYMQIRNFRCFENVLVPFSRPSGLPGHWTCVVGINGAGKSSILEALCLTLLGEQRFIRELGGVRLDRMRRKAGRKSLGVELRLWLREGRQRHYLELRLDTKPDIYTVEMQKFWEMMRSRLFVAYGATRNLNPRLSDFHQNLSPEVRRLMTIFDPLTKLSEERVLLGKNKLKGVNFRKLVANLVEQVFEGELKPVIPKSKPGIQFEIEGEPLDLVDLPDGFRSSVAWMGDLCVHWARMQPEKARSGDPSEIEGIVLIDEISLHLHPSLQREIVPRLRAALPRVQWVVTTHSPLILSSFDSREIIALDRDEPGRIRKLDRQIMGFSTDEIYRWLMHTSPSSAAMEEVLGQPPDGDDARESEIAQILRSPDTFDEEETLDEVEDFKQRLARIEKLRS